MNGCGVVIPAESACKVTGLGGARGLGVGSSSAPPVPIPCPAHVTCCLSGHALAGSWSWTRSWDLNPGALEWDAGVAGSVLTALPNPALGWLLAGSASAGAVAGPAGVPVSRCESQHFPAGALFLGTHFFIYY